MASATQTRGRVNGRSIGRFLIKAVVSAGMLWLALRHTPIVAVLHQMAAVDALPVLSALLTLAACTLLAAIRWSVILGVLGSSRGVRVTYPLSLIGLFFGQALPGGIGGDAVRIWLGCKEGLSPRVSFSSILADRLTGLFAILIIVTVEAPAIHRSLPDPALMYGLALLLAIGYIGIAAVMVLDKLSGPLRSFRLVRGLSQTSADLRSILLSPQILIVLLYGAAIQIGNILAIFFLALGLHLNVTVASCFLIVPLANIMQSIPISIAGWGVRESFFVAAFGHVGINAPQAAALSILFGLLVIAASLPGGALWLMRGSAIPRTLPDVTPLAQHQQG